MKGRITIIIALAAILLTCIVIVPAVALQVSPQDGSIQTDAFENTALQHIAQKHNIPIEQLVVRAKTEAHYRMIDKKLWNMKISDNKSHEIYGISMDMDGNIIDGSEIEEQEHRAYAEKYGKLEPALYDCLQGASGKELIKVGIWLTAIESERIEKDVLSKIDVDKRTDRNAARNEIFTAKKEVYALNEKPVIHYLDAKGFEIIYASFSAPLIFVELTREEIIALDKRDDVDRIYVWNKRYDGSGTKVAIVEWYGVDFGNPYLSGIMRPSHCVW